MRHPAGRVIGSGIFSRQRLAQQRLFLALLASVVLHGVLLSQYTTGTRLHPAPEPVPPVLVARVLVSAPSLKPPPPVAPITPAESTTATKQSARHTVRQPQVSVVDASSATTTSGDTHNPEPVAQSPSAPLSPYADRPLDLSPQAIGQAVRRSVTPGLAQAAREQLGDASAPAARALERQMASAAVPDCLHNSPDGEAKPSPVAIGGLFALPFLAYSAMTGKCK